MKKKIFYVSAVFMAITAISSCKQEPKMPTDAEIAQKVQDKYGAELNTLRDLKKMQCDETLNQKVGERLAAAQATTPAK